MIKFKASLLIGFLFLCHSGFSQSTHYEININEISRLLMDNQLDSGFQLAVRTTSDEPDIAMGWYMKGVVERQLYKHKESIRSFIVCRKLEPGHLAALHQLSQVYFDLQDFKTCIVYCDSILLTNQNDLAALMNKAQASNRAGLFVDAARLYQELHLRDTANGYFLRQLGHIYSKIDSLEVAKNWLSRAIKVDSLDFQAYAQLGSLFVRTEDYEVGLEVMSDALSYYPENSSLYRLRGSLQIMGALFSEGESDFRNALAYGDSTVFVYKHLGFCLFKESSYEQALEMYQKAVQLDPEDPNLWFYKAWCHKWQGDLTSSIESMEKALSLAAVPSISDIYSGLAQFHGFQREYDLAMHYFSRAYEWDETNPVPLAQMGMIVEQTGGKKEHAKTYYESFLSKAGPKDAGLIQYVNERMKIINEKMFMEGTLEKD